MDDRQQENGQLPAQQSAMIVELVHRRDVRGQTVEFLRRWFGPSAADVEPEQETPPVYPVAALWCAHRWRRTRDNAPENRTFSRPVVEAEYLIEDIDRAGLLNGEWNIYVRCTTLDVTPRSGRGKGNDTCQLPGLWVDLDAKDGVTWPDVERFIAALPVPVTAVTATGGGWHLWVNFTEPIYGLPACGAAAARWRSTVQRCAKEVGIKADDACSGDLARVMRLVGTANVKAERPEPVLCEFLRSDWHLAVRPDDVLDMLDAAPMRLAKPTMLRPARSDRPGDQYSASVPMLAILEEMGGHSSWTDERNGDTYVMRPGKFKGCHGAVIYGNDGHAAFYSSSWVGPGTSYPHVLLALSGEDGCVYNDSFRLLAHSRYGPGNNGYSAAKEYVQSLGFEPAWLPDTDAKFDELVKRLHSSRTSTAAVAATLPAPTMTAPAPVPFVPEPPPVWTDGYIMSGDILEAVWGFTSVGKQGSDVGYSLLSADRSGAPVAWVSDDGMTTFGAEVPAVIPTVTSGIRYRWCDLLAMAVDVDRVLRADDLESARVFWSQLADPTLTFDDTGLAGRLRKCVTGVEGIGRALEESQWKFTDAWEISERPDFPPVYLARTDLVTFLYPNKLNTIFGASESGKTWLVALAVLQCVRILRQHVLWFDIEEPGRAQIAKRMRQLGATEAECRMVLCLDKLMPDIIQNEYGKRWADKRAMAELVKFITENEIGLVVFDSYSRLAGSQDLDDLQKKDVNFLADQVLTPLTQHCALVLIDHTGHTTGPREFGAKGKRDHTDGISLYLEQDRRFMPGQGGQARIWVMKDRHGMAWQHTLATMVKLKGTVQEEQQHLAGVLRMTAGPGPVVLTFTPPGQADLPTVEGVVARAQGLPDDAMTPGQCLAYVIRKHGGAVASQNALLAATRVEFTQYKTKAFKDALDVMILHGDVIMQKVGAQRSVFVLIRDPNRKAKDSGKENPDDTDT